MKKLSTQQVADCKRFISFFSQIPARKWCVNALSDERGRHCVLGHLGVKMKMKANAYLAPDLTPDAEVLAGIIDDVDIMEINDGVAAGSWPGSPKQRVLKALKARLPK